MDNMKERRFPEVWPFIPTTTNVPIDADKLYVFFDAGMVLDDVYDSNLNYDQNISKVKAVLENDYGINENEISFTPEDLGASTVIMTGRQFVDQLYKIEPDNDLFILTVGRWSNMTEEQADQLIDEYFNKKPTET